MKGKSLYLIGTTLTLVLTSHVAVAQSSKSQIAQSGETSTSSPTEIKLSPEGFKILCERFPLNSRCPGNNSAVTPSSKPGDTTVETQPIQGNTPESTSPSVTGAPETNPVPGTTTLPAPGDNPAPGTTTLPAPGDNPAPGTTTLPAPGDNPAPGNTTLPAPGDNPAPGNTTPTPGKTLPAPSSPIKKIPAPGSSNLTAPESNTETTNPASGKTTLPQSENPGSLTPAPTGNSPSSVPDSGLPKIPN